jgi:hypothetical protein
MNLPTYQLLVDWSGTGNLNTLQPGEDVTADVIDTLRCDRGRNFASTLSGRSGPGRLSATLLNTSGIYSSSNPASALVNQLETGRLVQLLVNGAPRWTGYLQSLKPSRRGNVPVALLEAEGPLSRVANIKINPPALSGYHTGSAVETVLDAAKFPASLTSLDIGQTTMSRWFVSDINPLTALRELEETELGFVCESAAGFILFQGRQYRLTGSRTVAQATYSDAPGATYPYVNPIELEDPIRDLINRVKATVTPYSVGGTSVLWTLTGETPILSPGESRTWVAKPSSSAGDVLYVEFWVTPVAGLDYIVSGVGYGDIAVVVEKAATEMKITVTNHHASQQATFTTTQARGTPVTAGTPTSVQAEDTPSQTARGLREYPLPARWLPNTNVAQDYCNIQLANFKTQQTLPRLRFNAYLSTALFNELMTRDLSHRVTVVGQQPRTALGLARDFFVEHIWDEIDVQNSAHRVEMALSPATLAANFWILGTSVLGTGTVAGY